MCVRKHMISLCLNVQGSRLMLNIKHMQDMWKGDASCIKSLSRTSRSAFHDGPEKSFVNLLSCLCFIAACLLWVFQYQALCLFALSSQSHPWDRGSGSIKKSLWLADSRVKERMCIYTSGRTKQPISLLWTSQDKDPWILIVQDLLLTAPQAILGASHASFVISAETPGAFLKQIQPQTHTSTQQILPWEGKSHLILTIVNEAAEKSGKTELNNPWLFSVWPWSLPFTATWWCCFSLGKGFYVNVAPAAVQVVPSHIHGHDGDCPWNMGTILGFTCDFHP